MTDNGGFTLDGVPASTYGITLLYAPGQPMLPETRDRVEEITGKNGSYWFGSDASGRTFSLPCQFQATKADAAALDVLVRALAAVLVDESGKPKALSLVFDDSPTLTYIVRYSGGIPMDRAWVDPTEFTLNFVADDPFGYEAEQTDEKTITVSGDTMLVTGTGSVSGPAIITITNNGGAPITGFVITIEHV